MIPRESDAGQEGSTVGANADTCGEFARGPSGNMRQREKRSESESGRKPPHCVVVHVHSSDQRVDSEGQGLSRAVGLKGSEGGMRVGRLAATQRGS